MIKNIRANYKRLRSEQYDIDHVYKGPDYGWQGDTEGRALLAFCCHYEMTGKKIPCMDELIGSYKEHTNEFFGPVFDGNDINEQQISGNQWWMRGLLHYGKIFGDKDVLNSVKVAMENFFLKLADKYFDYPIQKNNGAGEVAGSLSASIHGWHLSSDVGCAFICMDCVSEYYEYFKDERAKVLFDNQLGKLLKVDFLKVNMQTHAYLTATRSVVRMYKVTGDKYYLDTAEKLLAFYLQNGMTLNYENTNWFGKPDSWTEPCAVVDSFIIATELYKLTGKADYLTLARRIWFNGLQFCQRENGGAGPDTCVVSADNFLKVSMYEAYFCCTMRYAEGLLEYFNNQSLFAWNSKRKEIIDEKGRRFIDDKLLVEYNGIKMPIFSLNSVSQSEALTASLKIIF